jgi:hypothetical protein
MKVQSPVSQNDSVSGWMILTGEKQGQVSIGCPSTQGTLEKEEKDRMSVWMMVCGS